MLDRRSRREAPDLLERIKGKRKRDVELLLAEVSVSRHIPDRIRIVPTPTPPHDEAPDLFAAASPLEPGRNAIGAQPEEPRTPQALPPSRPAAESARPPAPGIIRAELRFAASRPFLETLERLKALLWHQHPSGRLEEVLLTAMREYVERHDPLQQRRLTAACAPPPDPRSRRVSAALRRQVWARDDARCAYVGPAGRCVATSGLEIDHLVPWALGGRSDDPSNLRLLCFAHNQAERERIFGADCTRVQSVDK